MRNDKEIFACAMNAAKFGNQFQAERPIRITPDMADELLKYNAMNRNLRNRHVANLADSLSRGLWDSRVGQMIQLGTFNGNPVLVDGQHRLWAVTESGVSFNATLVTIGHVNEEGCKEVIIDVGIKRTDSDILGLPTNQVRTANTIIRLAAVGINSHTARIWHAADVKKVIGVIGSYLHTLDHINNTKRIWCSAAARAGMIAQMRKGEPQMNYTIESWKAICDPVRQLTPRLGAAIRLNGNISESKHGTDKQISTALWIYSALDINHKTETRIFTKADWVRIGLFGALSEILEDANVRVEV